jgi:hypothetical protein
MDQVWMASLRPARYDQIVTVHNPAVSMNTASTSTTSTPLHLLQSFVATATAGPDAGDILATRETGIPWLRDAGLMAADAVLTGSEHGALLRLRDALRESLASGSAAAGAAGTATADPDLAARLTRALSDGRLVVTITEAGAVKLHTAARSVYPSIVAAIAVAIAESDAAGNWPAP